MESLQRLVIGSGAGAGHRARSTAQGAGCRVTAVVLPRPLRPAPRAPPARVYKPPLQDPATFFIWVCFCAVPPLPLLFTAMAAKCLVLFAACLALSSAAVRREAPAASSPYQDLERHAADFQKTFNEQLNALVNSKNTQEVNKALKEGSDSVLQQLSALSSSLKSALDDANGKAKQALEETRSNLERTAEELRRAHPEVEQHANELKNKLQQAVQNTVQETQKLAKEVASNVEQTNQKLAPKIKEAYDDFVKQAEQVQQKLHEAATKQ